MHTETGSMSVFIGGLSWKKTNGGGGLYTKNESVFLHNGLKKYLDTFKNVIVLDAKYQTKCHLQINDIFWATVAVTCNRLMSRCF